ncbi:hypothetical protein [Burkholderia guangdongensis]|uniref:hypothetical protein n=1 Tax=Burkholderia guangdongensis TaxID=1792500 RepID=UPI0015C729D0|nr:hypothetical protein [Burkholderia guangdongensis]
MLQELKRSDQAIMLRPPKKIDTGEAMKRAWEITQLAFVWLLLGIGFFALYRIWAIVAFAEHSTKDFWDIATAVGTCGAVIAALYVASSDRRRRTADALVEARITAGFVTYRLGILRDEIAGIREWADETRANGPLPVNFLYQVQALGAAAKCTIDEIRSMEPLPNHCAIQIAGAQDRIDVAIKLLGKHEIWTALGTPNKMVIASLGVVVSAFLESENLLGIAIETCMRESEAIYTEMNARTAKSPGSDAVKLARQSIASRHADSEG